MTTLALPCLFPINRPLSKTHRRGFGLLEVILVFAIVIGAAAIVFTVFQSAQHRADVEHDRTLVRTLGANLSTLFHAPWDESNGPPVMMAYNQNPTTVGGPGCYGPDLDGSASPGQGCYSILTHSSLRVGEMNGTAFDVQINGVSSVSDCADFLTGGAGAFGATGISTQDDPIGVLATPTSQGDILTWCQAHAASDGSIDNIMVWWGHVHP